MPIIDKIIEANCIQSLIQRSRIHKVSSYFEHENMFMKRDDELGFGIGGSKVRKFTSLLKSIKSENPDFIVIEGSLNSNNVLGITALLNSLNLKCRLFLPQSHSSKKGNAIWTNQILFKDQIITSESHKGYTLEYYKQQLKTDNLFVVKEGASQIESIPGLLTLGQEINSFCQKEKLNFDSVYIDAGTGITAIALLISLKLLNLKPHVYITLIAGSEAEFEQSLNEHVKSFNKLFDCNLNADEMRFNLLKPTTAKSFGSVNSTIKQEWLLMMKELGFPVDLTYTAKHFSTVKDHLKTSGEQKKNLVINCGSWFASRNHESLFN